MEVSSSQDQDKSHPSHVFAVADSQKDQMFCKEVFRVEHELLSFGEALLRNSGLEQLSIVKPFTYTLPVVILFKRSVKRSLGKYWGAF